MRPDMDRVIIDTYRYGGHSCNENPNRREANMDSEDLPLKESMTKKWRAHWGGKEQADRLAPLLRWLEKQVGKKWNDVYSEVCHLFDKRSVSQSHLIDHLERMIEKNVEYIDGLPYKKIFGRRRSSRPISETEFYVCPDTGILKRGIKRKDPEKIKIENILGIHFKDGRSIEKVNGIWFEIILQKNENYKNLYPYWATYSQDQYGFIRYRTTGEYAMTTEKKRQLNKKEIRVLKNYIEECVKTINDIKKAKDRWKYINCLRYHEGHNCKGFFLMAWKELKF